MPRILVAGIGFTVDFVMRRVADLGRGEVSRVLLVALKTEDAVSWRRVEEAYRILSGYLSGLGIDSELHVARTGPGLVREVRDALARAASLAGRDGLVEVYVTGGPRILVVALTLAALTSSPTIRDRVTIVAYGEGFEAKLEVDAGRLARILTLDEEHRRILEALARLGGARAEQLRSLLDIKRSTLYLRLSRLEGEGLVVREAGTWRLHPRVEEFL